MATLPIGQTVLQATAVEQVQIYEKIEWPRPFLRELLFNRDIIFNSVAVQLNYRRFRRALAPFVGQYQYGRILMDAPTGAQLITLPAFGPTRVLRADDALPQAVCGYITARGTDWATQTIALNWDEMEASLSAREEWEIAQLLQTGGGSIKGA
jgi:major capsid protein E